MSLHVIASAVQSGTLGPFVAHDVAPKGWRLILTNSEDWPTTGAVCEILIERDGKHDYSITLEPDEWENHTGCLTVDGGWTSPCDVSLTVTMLQSCTLGLVWEAL